MGKQKTGTLEDEESNQPDEAQRVKTVGEPGFLVTEAQRLATQTQAFSHKFIIHAQMLSDFKPIAGQIKQFTRWATSWVSNNPDHPLRLLISWRVENINALTRSTNEAIAAALSAAVRNPFDQNDTAAKDRISELSQSLHEFSAILIRHGISAIQPDTLEGRRALPSVDEQQTAVEQTAPKLTRADRQRLVPILADRPMFATPDGRKAMLGLIGVEPFVDIDLNGNTQRVAASLVVQLNEYGRTPDGEWGVGLLLAYLLDDSTLPLHQKRHIEEMRQHYPA